MNLRYRLGLHVELLATCRASPVVTALQQEETHTIVLSHRLLGNGYMYRISQVSSWRYFMASGDSAISLSLSRCAAPTFQLENYGVQHGEWRCGSLLARMHVMHGARIPTAVFTAELVDFSTMFRRQPDSAASRLTGK